MKDRTLLIVEDEPDLRMILSYFFTRLGCRVRTASTAAACLAAVRREVPDLLILDVRLPDGDGRDVCAAVRERSRVPILGLTALRDRSAPVPQWNVCLEKPVSLERVADVARSLLARPS